MDKEPEEPLAESAPIAWREALRWCSPDPRTGESCAWYHRVWQYLRLLGVVTTTRTNTGFLIASFRKYAETGRYPRALVSASADYSMLAHLHAAYEADQMPLDATVLDLCETSLFLNRWYAERYGVRLTTVRAGVIDAVFDSSFDLVCTHNFLSFFDPETRRRIVARWHGLLRPGGIVVTTQRVQPRSHCAYNVFTPDQAHRLRERAEAAIRAYPKPLGVDPGELANAAYEFATRKRTFMIGSNQMVTSLFEEAGFEFEMVDEGGGAEERARDRPANSVGDDSYRMRIIARKP